MKTPAKQPDFGHGGGTESAKARIGGWESDTLSLNERCSLGIGMKTVRDLALWPLWVNPEHRVRSAVLLMKGHGVNALGVLSGETFVGVLHLEDLVGVPDESVVERYIRRDTLMVSPDDPLTRVADLMAWERTDRVAVVRDGVFYGIVSAHDLLGDVARNVDVVTGLPWSDALREWGVARLAEGREITILFFDLDDFGEFNKRFGHLVGDRVLRKVAEEMLLATDPQRDLVCRYAGDEFVVATLRLRPEAEALAQTILGRVNGALVEGGSKPISMSVGVFGGRRTRERENIHLASTLDNLINRASQECMAAKKAKAPSSPGPPPEAFPSIGSSSNASRSEESNGFRLEAVSVSPVGGRYNATAIVRRGDRSAVGSCYEAGTVAEAAVKAVREAVAELRGLLVTPDLEDVLVGERGGAPRFVTVVAGWHGGSGASTQMVTGDEAFAAAQAALIAIAEALAHGSEQE